MAAVKFTNYYQRSQFMEKRLKEYMTAYKIQQWWKEITISPKYKIGRKLIEKKYNSLFE